MDKITARKSVVKDNDEEILDSQSNLSDKKEEKRDEIQN